MVADQELQKLIFGQLSHTFINCWSSALKFTYFLQLHGRPFIKWFGLLDLYNNEALSCKTFSALKPLSGWRCWQLLSSLIQPIHSSVAHKYVSVIVSILWPMIICSSYKNYCYSHSSSQQIMPELSNKAFLKKSIQCLYVRIST